MALSSSNRFDLSQYSSTSSLPLLVSYLSPRLDLTMARKDSSKHWD